MNDIVTCISGWVFGQSWMTYKWYMKWYAHDHWIWVAVWIKIRSLKNWDAYKYQPIGPQMTLVCSFSWSSSCYISSHNLNERINNIKQPLWYPHLCLSHSQISQLSCFEYHQNRAEKRHGIPRDSWDSTGRTEPPNQEAAGKGHRVERILLLVA